MPIAQGASLSPFRQQRWVECLNVSGGELAAFSVVQIVGSETLESDRTIWQVQEATKDSPEQTAILGPYAIAQGGYGICTIDLPAYARVASGTPSNGEIWGLATGATAISSGYEGFVILGDFQDGIVRVLRGCTCGRCLIFSDDFNRTDSTSVSWWTEVSGDWSIASNQLHEDGNSGALIITNAGRWNGSQTVEVVVPALADGAIYRLYCNYLDASNYFMVQYEILAASLTIKLYKGASLLKEESWIFEAIGEEAGLFLYLTEETFTGCLLCLTVRADPFCRCHLDPAVDPGLITGGTKAGLGNGAGIAIDYDGFSFQEMNDTLAGCPICAVQCGCRCCSGDTLCDDGTADLCFSIASDYAPLDGLTGVMTRSDDPDPSAGWYWEWNDDPPGTNFLSQVGLTCDAEGDRYHAYSLYYSSTGASCVVTFDTFESGSCDPFELVWSGHIESIEGGCDDDDGKPVTITVNCCPPAPIPLALPRQITRIAAGEPSETREGLGLLQKGKHYATAIAKWVRAGRPTRTDTEVNAVLAICAVCDKFDVKRCLECGCCINKGRSALTNKARMGTEHCPRNFW